MAHRDIIVIGASAGGLHALVELLAPLPVDLRATLFIVVHTAREGTGKLPDILTRAGALNAAYAKDGDALDYGRIYIAPLDHHLLVKRSGIRVAHGPRENRFRPAIDPLFRTAARAFGPRVIGVVLSGGLDDGTHGLELIKRHGGSAIAQDPESALVPSMPMSAIQNVEVDHILSPKAIAAKLPLLVCEEVADDVALIPAGDDVAEGRTDNLKTGHVPGPPSPFTCPACGGALWELEDSTLLRFRCHVGHGYTGEALAVDQGEGLEHAMWGALRALEEHATLRRRMAQHAMHVGREVAARAFERAARDAEKEAGTMRQILLKAARDSAAAPDQPEAETASRSARPQRPQRV